MYGWLGLVLLAGSVSAGCAAAGRPGEASSYLIVDSLQAASGAEPGALGGTLNSDVLTNGTIYPDVGVVEFRLAMKNPEALVSPANFITLRRYRVTYRRSDGRNTPGVDVPWGFDGVLTTTISTQDGSADFTLVRIQAKVESPLMGLANLGGAITISTLAEVTFYGTDQAGREVVATAHIGINFADWGDPE
jgi:hypothetical protein